MPYEPTEWIDKTAITPGTKINRQRMMKLEQGLADATDKAEEALSRGGTLLPVSGTATIPVTPSGGLVGYRVLPPGVTLTAPDFSTISLQPGVYILENAPGGWVVHEVAEGSGGFTPPSGPILIDDPFTTDRADLYASVTPTGGAQYERGIWAAFGAPYPPGGQMQVVAGQAYHTSGNGAGAFVPVEGLDWSVEVGYDVSSATANTQVRVAARGDHQYVIPAGRANMPAQLIVRNTGVAQFEPFWNGTAWVSKELATGQPQTGTARLDVQGSTARCYINDVLIATETFDEPQQAGTHVGFGTYLGGRVTGFTATRIGP